MPLQQCNRELFKVMKGKTLFSALYGIYTVTLNDYKKVLKDSTQQVDGFKEVRSRKKHCNKEAACTAKKAALPASTVKAATKNFAPLRTTNMDTDTPGTESTAAEEAVPGNSGRPFTIVLTPTNLTHLQKQLKGMEKQTFEFRSTKNGTRVVTKDIVNYQSVKAYFDSNNLSYYIFYPKSDKPIKAVMRHLPVNTPAEGISERLVNLGFDVISVKQMSTARRSPEGTTHITLPMFLVTLPRTTKSQDLYKLSTLCHISIKVESYKSQNALTQCYNCQKFGHVWPNCKQPPRCLWCGGGHLHRDCQVKGNASSTPGCCNCQLTEGQTAHPTNYRGCKHAKEEMQKKKQKGTPKNATGRVFASKFIKPSVSFAAALLGHADQKTHDEENASASIRDTVHPNTKQQETGQSVPAPSVNSELMNNMIRVVTVVQQIMTSLKGAVSEQAKIMTTTIIVFNLMQEDCK
jgi:hypothetical protein